MIDLSPLDSPPGVMPLRAGLVDGVIDPGYQPRRERVLHVHLFNPHEPQTGLKDALAKTGLCRQVDWPRLDSLRLQQILVERSADSSLIFMQLQTPNVVDTSTLEQMRARAREDCVIVSWCGDIGRNPAWSHELAPYVDALLFSSVTQAREHRQAGFANAGYLQIGYDTDIHHTGGASGLRSGVVFLGQNYRDSQWPFMPGHEAQLRRDTVSTLTEGLGDLFACYGQNWPAPHHDFLCRELSAERYRRAQCAINVSLTSKLERFSSDRLFRALACGPVVLCKRFVDCEALGLSHGKNCLLWDTSEECLEQARSVMALPEIEQRTIGEAGARLARDHHTWDVRVHELVVYLDYIRSQRA